MVSCTSYQVKRQLNDIESYIQDRPDSALSVLENIDRDNLRSQKNKAYYALLHAMALDKNYINVTDDSLARTALNYFEKWGPKKYKARALYYLGLSKYYDNKFSDAIIFFTQSEDIARESLDSLYIAFSLVGQADVYNQIYNDAEEIECLKEAVKIFQNLSTDYYEYATKSRLGDAYIGCSDFDSSERILAELLDSNKYDNLYALTLNRYAYLQMVKEPQNPELASKYYSLANEEYSGNLMTVRDYWAWATALSMTGEKEQSQELISQLEVIDTTSSSDYWKYFISKGEGDYISALHNLEKSSKKESKYVVQALGQSLALTQRDYYEAQSDLAHYKIKIRTLITLITIAFTVLLIVILFVVIASRIRKYKEEKEKYIQYVEEMTRQLNEIQKEEVPSLKRKYLELYKKKLANLRVLCDTYLQFQGRDNAEKMMYSRVVAMVNELKVDMQDHLKLEAMLDEDLNGVMTALRREVKMKEIDYIIFAYIALGFDATTISRLIDTSVNTVYIRKSRIKKLIEESDISFKDTFMVILS